MVAVPQPVQRDLAAATAHPVGALEQERHETAQLSRAGNVSLQLLERLLEPADDGSGPRLRDVLTVVARENESGVLGQPGQEASELCVQRGDCAVVQAQAELGLVVLGRDAARVVELPEVQKPEPRAQVRYPPSRNRSARVGRSVRSLASASERMPCTNG